MGNYQRRKGGRLEREVVNMLRGEGFEAKRVSMLETGGIDKGDVESELGMVQVKGGKQVPKFLYKSFNEGEDLMICKRDYKEWMVVVPFDKFIKLLEE